MIYLKIRCLAGVPEEKIVNWFVEQNFQFIQNMSQAERLGLICYGVIESLIKKDKILIIKTDNPDFKKRGVYIHSNYTESL